MPNFDPASKADHEPISELGEQGEKLIERMHETGRPVILTHKGRDSFVLLHIADYERLLDELDALRDVHQAQKDIDAGRVTPHDDVKARLLARYS